MKRSLILLTLLLAATCAMQAQADTSSNSDAYTDFELLILLNQQPLPVILVVEILDLVSTDFDDPFDINGLNISFNPADDENEPQPL